QVLHQRFKQFHQRPLFIVLTHNPYQPLKRTLAYLLIRVHHLTQETSGSSIGLNLVKDIATRTSFVRSGLPLWRSSRRLRHGARGWRWHGGSRRGHSGEGRSWWLWRYGLRGALGAASGTDPSSPFFG